MVQLSQILNIRNLEIRFIQTILISTVLLKNNSMQTDMDIQTYTQTVSTVLFARLTNVSYTGAFSDTRYLLAYYYSNQIK